MSSPPFTDDPYYPGPPRFTTVDDSVRLSPPRVDAPEQLTWSVADAPRDSDASVGEGAIVWFTPDEPGRYRVVLETPDGRRSVTVIAVPNSLRTAEFSVARSRFPGDVKTISGLSIIGHFCSVVFGRHEVDIGDERVRYETEVAPGNHPFCIGSPSDSDFQAWDTQYVPGPSRPTVALDGDVEDGRAVVEATVGSPEIGSKGVDPEVRFVLEDPSGGATMHVDDSTATIPLSSLSGPIRVHAVAVAERPSVADAVTVSASGVDRLNDPPGWIEDAVVYSVFARAFGSSLAEIEARLDHLERIGVDCVYLTPIYECDEQPHGYNITDFFSVADDLGSREEFESLVDACHDRGIRVVLDLVINHAARSHPYVQRALDGDERYRDWFHWRDRDEAVPEFNFGWWQTVNFDLDERAVHSFLFDVVDHWAPLVDGFRCDVAQFIPHDVWKQLRTRVRSIDPEFLLIDESLPYSPQFHELEFDVHYDHLLESRLTEIGSDNLPAAYLLDVPRERRRTGFPAHATYLQYAENHDSDDRYIAECNEHALRAAAGAAVCLPGVPMVYAGQELGATDVREPLPWDDTDEELIAFHRRLIDCYHRLPALSSDAFEPVNWTAGSDGVVAFARGRGEDRTVVVLNFDREPALVSIDEQISRDCFEDVPVTAPFAVESVRLLQ